ncbi:protein starmaker-like [Palaemon carinicauda]|uniref:protein starmaker-like n=1 Tax=Palaemon carinicauda TaxID=392227 RepID=UPI0035B58D6C
MGEGAVGGVSSVSGNGLIVDERAKVSNNGKGSDSDCDSNSDSEIEDKGISEEVGKKKEGSSDDSSENERDVCKIVFMREVPRCERFNEHSSMDVYVFFKEYERYCQDKYGDMDENAKVSDNGKGIDSDSKSNSDSEIEDKGIRHSKDEQECDRNHEKKGKSDVKKEKKTYQADSKDDRDWVKVANDLLEFDINKFSCEAEDVI